MTITVIKKYNELVTSLKSAADLDYETDRAVSDFRAFHAMAILQATRASNRLAIDLMRELLADVDNTLQSREEMLHSL